MQGLERQMLRFGLVGALASGLAFVAAHAAAPKVAARENPAPIVLAVALERNTLPTHYFTPDGQSARQGARVDQCQANPHAMSDHHLIGDKSAQGATKRKVVFCG
jgi:hypothetical protein